MWLSYYAEELIKAPIFFYSEAEYLLILYSFVFENEEVTCSSFFYNKNKIFYKTITNA